MPNTQTHTQHYVQHNVAYATQNVGIWPTGVLILLLLENTCLCQTSSFIVYFGVYSWQLLVRGVCVCVCVCLLRSIVFSDENSAQYNLKKFNTAKTDRIIVAYRAYDTAIKQMLQNLHELLLRQHYRINNVILQSIAPTVSLGTVKIVNIGLLRILSLKYCEAALVVCAHCNFIVGI